jgi:hypothetical protein
MKNVKISFNLDEIILLSSGLGSYYDYLEGRKKKEKIEGRRRLEKVQRDIESLVKVINDARGNIK